MARVFNGALLGLLLLGIGTAPNAVAQSTPRSVVVAFYKYWFKSKGAISPAVVAERSLFEPSFYKLILQTDKLESPGDADGYDMDPFFCTQWGTYSYRIGASRISNSVATVPVYSTAGRGNKPVGPERLVVTVKLANLKGGWYISDVLYPHASGDSMRATSEELLGEQRRYVARCRTFVTAFYTDWRKWAHSDNGQVKASEQLAKERARFDPDLYSLVLRTFQKAEQNSGQGVSGYDEDPFFDTQSAVSSFRLGDFIVHRDTVIPIYIKEDTQGKERLCVNLTLHYTRTTLSIVDLTYPHRTGKDASLRTWSEGLLAP